MKRFRLLIVAMYLMSFSAPLVTMAQTPSNKNATPVNQQATKETLQVKNSQIIINSNWVAENNFVSSTDVNGKKLEWKDIKKDVVVTGAVDTKKVGVYKVTYTYNKLVQTATIEVIEQPKPVKPVEPPKDKKVLTQIKAKNVVIPFKGAFDISQSFDFAIDSEGKTLAFKDVASLLKVDNQVDTTKLGTHKVTFTYGNLISISEVTVVAIPTKINLKPVTIEVGKTWNISDNFVSIDMSDGSQLGWEAAQPGIVIDQNPDITKPGVYNITYSYQGISNVTQVTVQGKQVAPVEVKVVNRQFNVGDVWSPELTFDSVIMSDGTKLVWKDVADKIVVNGKVDTSQAGTYSIIYTYGDKSATAIVTVKAAEVIVVQEVSVKDSTIPIGTSFKPADNLNYVMMSNGTKLTWKDIEKDIVIKGQVDTQKAGTYKITYEYGDKSAVATVIVKDMEVIKVQEISLKDTTLTVGMKWQASDNFNYVLMSDGVKLSWQDVAKEMKIKGDVDTKKVGTYKVTYTYKDKSNVATIQVKEVAKPKVDKVFVKDSSLTVGAKWQASDNFNYVLMTNGSKLAFKDVVRDMKVTGNVDTNKVGTYKVTYEYGGKSAVATIVVKEKAITGVHSLFVKNTTLQVGNKWQASDNFVGVKMADGRELVWKDVVKDIKVKGNVDTNKVGKYTVTYSYGDKTETATVEVFKKTVAPVKPTTKKPTLPQTGEKDSFITFVVGLVILVSTFLVVTFKIKKAEEE